MKREQNGLQHWHRHTVRRCAWMLFLSFLFKMVLGIRERKTPDKEYETEVPYSGTETGLKLEPKGDTQLTPICTFIFLKEQVPDNIFKKYQHLLCYCRGFFFYQVKTLAVTVYCSLPQITPQVRNMCFEAWCN